MSGIALVLHLDGRPAVAGDIAPLLAEMHRRGPEGEDIVISGPAALGHRHLATTPEAEVEPMPFTDARSGCILTGEIRLDNRDVLLSAFGLHAAERVVGDGELVLRSWERWGEDCACHLLGDFAFAIWDSHQRIVFAARDQMGMRQLIYVHREGRVFGCSSSARATVRTPGVTGRLNELRLAEALIGFEWGSLTRTFYEDVWRLPPGHCLCVKGGRLSQRAYWTMTPPSPVRLTSDGEYAEAFRDILSEAVRCRLRGAGPVGSMLSGGMDSGSVVALASRMVDTPFPTFSGVGPDSGACVETRAIMAALNMPNLRPTLIDHSRLRPYLDDLVESCTALEEPWDLHMTQPRTAYLAAQRAGVKVLLDGVGGDVVLGAGSQMARDIRAGAFTRAFRDARGLSAFYGLGSGHVVRQLAAATRSALVPGPLRRGRAVLWQMVPPPIPKDSAVDPALARATALRHVLAEWHAADRSSRMEHAEERIWSWPRSGLTVARERYDRVAAHFGVEPRDPFHDRRVLEFCLGLPVDQLQKGGWPKIILRRATEGLLPDVVRWRRGKEHLGSLFTRHLMEEWNGWRDVIRAARPELAGRASAPHLTDTTLTGISYADLSNSTDLALQTALFLLAERPHGGVSKDTLDASAVAER